MQPQHQRSLRSQAPARLLVVDDEAPNRDMLARRLERAGYHVIQRSDALSIEDDVAGERVEAILLDWRMPERSGAEALAALRRRYDAERLPIIVATAIDDDDVVAEALEAGANDYVTKPISFRVLLARLNAQLAHRAAVRELDAIRGGLEKALKARTRQLRAEMDERAAAEAHARSMAMHDALTGLPNRRLLGKALGALLAELDACSPLAIVALDLDRFKPVNDLYGHAAGDELLVQIGDLLREHVAPDGLAARIGGDEFVLVLPNAPAQVLDLRLAALAAAFAAPFRLREHEASVGATLGVAVAPLDGQDGETLVRRADLALRRAKERGRGGWSFFEQGMDERAHERAALENDLRIAIRTGAIEPYFQPLVRLETGEVEGYEILARWPHPGRGLVLPNEFIPVAEESGLIGELTMCVLRRACTQAASWAGAQRISLNISPVQLKDAMLPQRLLKVLTETGFPPQRLEIEITEDALVFDFAAARRVLMSLKNQGVRLALDDFGTGYSSLRHLRELPFDALKIDRGFVQSMTESDKAYSLVRTIVALAKNLGLAVAAEGIESADHARALRALGCELGQGYYFGRAAAQAAAESQGRCVRHQRARAESRAAVKRAV